MATPRSENNVNETKHGATSSSRRGRRFGTHYRSRRGNNPRRLWSAARLPAPRHADQEAEAERKANGRQRALRDDLLQRFLNRGRGVLSGSTHRAAAFGYVVHRLLRTGAGLLVAAPRLLGGGARKIVEGVGDLIGEGC